MAKIDELICISCPRGCTITVTDGTLVTGNFCKKGESYALQEVTNPVRVLTVLMRPEGSDRPVSVKTSKAVPKAMLKECAKAIYAHHPALPVKTGDILIQNLLGTGADVIATCDSDDI